MNGLSEAERFLIEAVRRGDEQAWPQLVARYQGRLLAFARQRARRPADAEDYVQEAFIGLLRGIGQFRGDASLETYLFTILRRRIIDAQRGQAASLCLLNDQLRGKDDNAAPVDLPAPDPTASWYVRRDERHDAQRIALAEAITQLVSGYKESLNFRELQVIELLFYAQLGNSEVAEAVGVTPGHVASIKHRSLARIRKQLPPEVRQADEIGGTSGGDALLTEVWEDHRPSCPKRSTIGAFHLGTLDPGNRAWHDYVDFHLHKLGCRFCLANLHDMQAGEDQSDRQRVRQRILQSTVGFLKR